MKKFVMIALTLALSTSAFAAAEREIRSISPMEVSSVRIEQDVTVGSGQLETARVYATVLMDSCGFAEAVKTVAMNRVGNLSYELFAVASGRMCTAVVSIPVEREFLISTIYANDGRFPIVKVNGVRGQ